MCSSRSRGGGSSGSKVWKVQAKYWFSTNHEEFFFGVDDRATISAMAK